MNCINHNYLNDISDKTMDKFLNKAIFIENLRNIIQWNFSINSIVWIYWSLFKNRLKVFKYIDKLIYVYYDLNTKVRLTPLNIIVRKLIIYFNKCFIYQLWYKNNYCFVKFHLLYIHKHLKFDAVRMRQRVGRQRKNLRISLII